MDLEPEPDGRPTLTVYSICTTVPRPATFLPSREELIDRDEEDYFPFYVASTAPLPNPRWYSHWLRAVRDPNRRRNVEQDFEVEAEFELLPTARVVHTSEAVRRPWRSALH